jgi:hypothetical protein
MKANGEAGKFVFFDNESERGPLENKIRQDLKKQRLSEFSLKGVFVLKLIEKNISLPRMANLLGFDDLARAWRYWKWRQEVSNKHEV